MINSIKLIDLNNEEIILKLHTDIRPYTIEEVIRTTHTVKEDGVYQCYLEFDPYESKNISITDLMVWINNDEKKVILNGNMLFFDEPKDERGRIFKDYLGFMQIKIGVKTESEERIFFSEFASILVKDGPRITHINGMIEYVYKNQSDLLKHTVSVNSAGNEKRNNHDDFWSQIVLLEEIINVYESCYGYFKANSRNKLVETEVLDRIDHLKFVDQRTISYIAQHPEYLHRDKNGIRYGRQNYLPTKTMMNQNMISKDTYENQIILAFLRRVIADCETLKCKVESVIADTFIDVNVESGYVLSSYILYVNAKNTLKKYNDRLSSVEEKLHALYLSYKEIFEFESNIDDFIPSPTPIFLSVPQYNRIYNCISKWVYKTGYDIVKERAVLNFIDSTSVYEAYVLIKLINQFKSWGFSLIDSKNIEYYRDPYWYYKNKEYNNTFILKNEEKTVTVYYSPIVYDTDRSSESGLSLYRNNSVSIEYGFNPNGTYYNPDYILKCEWKGRSKYVICDAKLSHIRKVRDELMPKLAYKYLFSISPTDEASKIVGMDIFYGITSLRNHSTVNFYDNEFSNKISPFASMIPMSIEVDWEEQESNLFETLRALCFDDV